MQTLRKLYKIAESKTYGAYLRQYRFSEYVAKEWQQSMLTEEPHFCWEKELYGAVTVLLHSVEYVNKTHIQNIALQSYSNTTTNIHTVCY